MGDYKTNKNPRTFFISGPGFRDHETLVSSFDEPQHKPITVDEAVARFRDLLENGEPDWAEQYHKCIRNGELRDWWWTSGLNIYWDRELVTGCRFDGTPQREGSRLPFLHPFLLA